jgi:hypothetical protein
MRGMMPAFDFEAADTDGDGALTRAEFTAHVEARIEAARDARIERHAAAIMEAGDADGDGMLSLRSCAPGSPPSTPSGWSAGANGANAAPSAGPKRAERRAERGERACAAIAGMRHGMRGMHGGDRAQMIDRMFDRIDADGDGTISAEEFEAAQARWQERSERRGQRRGD